MNYSVFFNYIVTKKDFGSMKNKKPLIIFDMDGVLIDVSLSYREVTRESVVYYLTHIIGLNNIENDFITLKDVDLIKKAGGLNNDWDLTYTIINAILIAYFDEYNKYFYNDFKSLKYIKNDSILLRKARDLCKRLNKNVIISKLKKKPICEVFKSHKDKLKSYSPFLLNRHDVKTGNIVKRIFQEMYLGEELFKEIYNENPLFYHKSGYIDNEVLIPSISEVEKLFSSNLLSIATGRPEGEAVYALKRFKIDKFFKVVVSEDDVMKKEMKIRKSLRKPDPYILNSCIGKSSYIKGDPIYYIGDMPDDILSAKKAGIIPVGFVNEKSTVSSSQKQKHHDILKQKGAYKIFGNFKEIIHNLTDMNDCFLNIIN